MDITEKVKRIKELNSLVIDYQLEIDDLKEEIIKEIAENHYDSKVLKTMWNRTTTYKVFMCDKLDEKLNVGIIGHDGAYFFKGIRYDEENPNSPEVYLSPIIRNPSTGKYEDGEMLVMDWDEIKEMYHTEMIDFIVRNFLKQNNNETDNINFDK